MQIVVLKAYRNKISDKRNIGVTQSAPLFYPKAERISAKSKAILRRQKLARIPVGEQRNFCFAEIRRPVSRSCGGVNLYKPCRRIKAGERCSPLPPFVGLSQDRAGKQVRAVEGASPYMVCKVHNKVRITQVQIKNAKRKPFRISIISNYFSTAYHHVR